MIPTRTKYIAWAHNALLIQTEQGVFLWTHASHPMGHVFRLVAPGELWFENWHIMGEWAEKIGEKTDDGSVIWTGLGALRRIA